MAAHAAAVPVGNISLDQLSPTKDIFTGNWDWWYTISVTGGGSNGLADVSSVEILDVAGVTGVAAPCFGFCGWSASFTALGGNLFDVTFTNNFDTFGSSLDGFMIESTYKTAGEANYNLVYQQSDPSGVVGAPAATPEPGTFFLTGLALAGLAGMALRRI
ncbi:MAG TPA: PEP-CTERM sorting domain-containing protein [Bryobacteraceae bacterium]|nr:PEP-CTERM sorting domain-containing protein [Bryobacteraceae bacterium]